jgi:hypothetical protein
MLLHDFFDIKKPKVKEDSWHGGGNEPKDAWHSEAGVVEDRVDSPVSSAITRRILNQRHDLLKFGPQAVMDAIDQVAEWVGEVEEIGSSDVSAWVAQVARHLQTQDGQGVAEGLPGEFVGGTAGGVGGAVVGAAVGGPIGAVVGGAAGGTAGQIAGRELTDEQKLNEFGPLLVAGARLFMAAAPKIAQVFGKVGQAGARGVGQAAKAGAGIAAKNAGQIGVGVGAYEIGSSVADIVKDITAKVGAAVDEKTIFDLATLAFKYAIPAGIVLAILYGGKKAIDSLFADPKTPQGVAEASNTMQRYGQKIIKRAREARAAEAREKAEKEKAEQEKADKEKNKGVPEEEQIDELSKDTLTSYAKKAVPDFFASHKKAEAEHLKAASAKTDRSAKKHYDAAKQAKHRAEKRTAGIGAILQKGGDGGAGIADLLYRGSNKKGVAEGEDNLESLRAKAKQISDKIDSIVQSGGRVGLDDPLSRQLKAIRNKIKQAKQGVAEASKTRNPTRDFLRKHPVPDSEMVKPVKKQGNQDAKTSLSHMMGGSSNELMKNLKIKEQGVSEGANYWTKLQDTRNKKINSLVDELEKSIK